MKKKRKAECEFDREAPREMPNCDVENREALRASEKCYSWELWSASNLPDLGAGFC